MWGGPRRSATRWSGLIGAPSACGRRLPTVDLPQEPDPELVQAGEMRPEPIRPLASPAPLPARGGTPGLIPPTRFQGSITGAAAHSTRSRRSRLEASERFAAGLWAPRHAGTWVRPPDGSDGADAVRWASRGYHHAPAAAERGLGNSAIRAFGDHLAAQPVKAIARPGRRPELPAQEAGQREGPGAGRRWGTVHQVRPGRRTQLPGGRGRAECPPGAGPRDGNRPEHHRGWDRRPHHLRVWTILPWVSSSALSSIRC
jgi:hypothetical protein